MASRHHTSTLVGLGALLGLTALGCQSEPIVGQTGGPAQVAPSPPRPSLFQAVRLMKPQQTAEGSGPVQTAQAMSGPAYPVRQAGGPDMGGGAVIASSFRMTARPGSYAQPTPAGELTPPPTLYSGGVSMPGSPT